MSDKLYELAKKHNLDFIFDERADAQSLITLIEEVAINSGEVMRERCWHAIPFGQIKICDEIRAIPSVKLEDLQK